MNKAYISLFQQRHNILKNMKDTQLVLKHMKYTCKLNMEAYEKKFLLPIHFPRP